MLRIFAAASALALATAPAAFAQPMPGAAAGAAMPTPAFTRAAAQSDEFEIAEAHVALKMSQDPQVRMFARKMIHDHTQSTMMIKAALSQSGHAVPPAPPLTPEQDHMLADLRGSGSNFAHVYLDQQLKAHEMALSVQQAYASGGSDPALRHAASEIVPVVQSHLQMIHDMQTKMG